MNAATASRTCRLLLASLLGTTAAAASSADPDTAAPGESLVAIIAARDAEALRARVDVDALLERVLDGTDLGERDRRDFSAGFRKSSADIGSNLLRNVELNRARPRLVRSDARGEGTVQTVRLDMYDANGDSAGYDYIEFELGADQRIRDWRSHAQAGRVSDTIRLLTANLFDTGTFASMLFGRASADEQGLEDMGEFVAAMKRGDFRAAHAALGRLPAKFQATRQCAAIRAALAANFDEEVYREDLARLARDHGSDPEVQLMLVDHYMYVEDYESMVAAVQRFERRVVADGATNVLECSAWSLMQRWDDAERTCRESTRLEPDFETGWWTLVGLYAQMREGPKLLATLDEIEQRFDKQMDPDALLALDDYAWLAREPAFASWAQQRR